MQWRPLGPQSLKYLLLYRKSWPIPALEIVTTPNPASWSYSSLKIIKTKVFLQKLSLELWAPAVGLPPSESAFLGSVAGALAAFPLVARDCQHVAWLAVSRGEPPAAFVVLGIPIQGFTRPDPAWLVKSDGIPAQGGMAAGWKCHSEEVVTSEQRARCSETGGTSRLHAWAAIAQLRSFLHVKLEQSLKQLVSVPRRVEQFRLLKRPVFP